MDTLSNPAQSLVCDLTAIPADVREEHIVAAPQLFASAQEAQELDNGYAIRFLNEPNKFMSIAKFIEKERLCCPFFNFGLEIEANNGPIWLKLTGGEGVKEMLQTALFENIEDKTKLKLLIQTGGDAHLDEVVASANLPSLQHALTSKK